MYRTYLLEAGSTKIIAFPCSSRGRQRAGTGTGTAVVKQTINLAVPTHTFHSSTTVGLIASTVQC